MIRISILLVFLGIIFPLKTRAEYFKNLDTSSGLSQTSVMAIFQDKLDRMWFGTREGISIYDGRKMINYKPWAYNYSATEGKQEFRVGNYVKSIVGDREDNIYIFIDQDLIRYDIEHDSFKRLRAGNVRSLCASNNGDIYCICTDSLFKYNIEKESLEFYAKTGLSSILCQMTTADGLFWFGTRDGLYTMDNSRKLKCVIRDEIIWGIFESSNHEIWVGTQGGGLFRIINGEVIRVAYNPSSPKYIASMDIRCFTEDNDGNIWIGTFDGLQKYDPNTDTYTLYTQAWNKGSLKHSSTFSVYKDRHGTIWAGSYYGGVCCLSSENDIFTHYNYNPDRTDCISYPLVGKMTEDKNGDLWICLDGGGLTHLNRANGRLTNYRVDNSGLPSNNLRAIRYDIASNCLFIGTHKGGLCRLNCNTGQFYNYLEHFPSETVPNEIIDCLYIWNGCLLVGARNGLFMIELQTNKITKISEDIYAKIVVDADNQLWGIVDNSFLRKIDLKTMEDKLVDSLRLSGYTYLSALAEYNGKLLIGTLGDGVFVYNKKTHSVEHLTEEDNHLLDNYCYSINMTNHGHILMAGGKGITLFNPLTKSSRFIELSMGMYISSISNGCGVYVCSDDEIFVGGTDGMVSFKEADFDLPAEKTLFYFSSLSVNNEKVHPNDGSGILAKALPFVKRIDLAYNENNIEISTSSSNYVDLLSNISYEYKLEGLDEKWVKTDRMDLHYTNLSPGNYTLRVCELGNSLQTRTSQEISLIICIHPPWYNTWWARLLYFLAIASVLLWLYRVKMARHRLSLSLEQERIEKRSIAELNQAKLRFFTNVSHEFRTPLTLIIAQVDMLLQNKSLNANVYNNLLKIVRHTKQLLNLVSELLDFRKFEQSMVMLKLDNTDFVQFAKEIHLAFSEYACQRSINYQFECSEKTVMCWFDRQQMEKVVLNLLSNAFKFTPNGGNIYLSIMQDDAQVIFTVQDDGVGIKEEDIEYIFERFYQVDNAAVNNPANPGAGIGLALARNIVNLHHGTIWLESEYGKGCRFIVALPMGKDCFSNDKNVEWRREEIPTILPDTIPSAAFVEESIKQFQNVGENATFKILMVEDNEDLLETLHDLFVPYYEVTVARNGSEGLAMARSMEFDLILSDVMMPEMSGTEMCMQIKNDLNLCHIPVILLTALDSVEQCIEGLHRGADDYISKPFNGKELLTRCNNMVRNRRLLQERFMQKKDIMDVSLLANNLLDKTFLDKVLAVIDANLDKEDFDVPFLCQEVGVSRTLLQNKFKGLTGMSPNEFIINHKIKLAAAMLVNEPHLQVSDVSERFGFSSPRYFSKIFKIQLGVSPMDYRKKID